MEKKKLIVATDFTPVAESAINHASLTASFLSAEVHLVHIIADESEREAAEAKLEEERKLVLDVDHHIPVYTHALVGNIYDTIPTFATEIHANFIFMGTHGMSGMQFITGSKALKVVKESTVPFVITQDKNGHSEGFKNIIVPITLDVQTKQKLRYAVKISRYFRSTLHLVAAGETDEDFSRKVTLNMKFAINFLREEKVDFTTQHSKNIGNKFLQDILEIVKEKNGDLITIMNMSDTGILNLFGSHFEQDLITNESKIPVMLINPFEDALITGSYSS